MRFEAGGSTKSLKKTSKPAWKYSNTIPADLSWCFIVNTEQASKNIDPKHMPDKL